MTTPRIPYMKTLSDLLPLLQRLEATLAEALPLRLRELVKMRVSQMNRCAFCLHMHTREALAAGEAAERLLALPAFRESPLFSAEERAVLAYTESLTEMGPHAASDAEFEALREHLDDAQIAHLTLSIGMINLWNRLAVGMRGVYPEQRLTTLEPPRG